MAGIEFDRQAFVQAEHARRNSITSILGLSAGILVLAGVAYLGYRMISSYSSTASSVHDSDILSRDQIQQQLSEMDKRIDQLEKHHKTMPSEVSAVPAKPEPPAVAASPRPAYKVKGASALAPQTAPVRDSSLATRSYVEQNAAAAAADSTANREAWKATTDRLADVVGVVGSQQSELAQTREDVNGILSKTIRKAIPFELRRGASREPIGPVSLLLKNADVKAQRYTVCVYVEEQCVELKNRAVNEVIGFVLSRNSAHLEFVATKVLRDQIVGYLEVPAASSR